MQITLNYKTLFKTFIYLLTAISISGCQGAKSEVEVLGRVSKYKLDFTIKNNSRESIYVAKSLVNNRIETDVFWLEGIYRNKRGGILMYEFSFSPKKMIEILPGEVKQQVLKGKFDEDAKYFIRVYEISYQEYLKKVDGEITASTFRKFQEKHSKLVLINMKE